MKKLYWSGFILLLFITPAYSFDKQAVHNQSADLPRAADKSTLVAVIHHDSPPTFFRDPKTGNASGFEVDVLNKIAEQSGFTITYIFGNDWTDIINKVETGEADLAPGLGITEERIKKLVYTDTLDSFPISLFVRSGSSIKGLQTGLKIGVPRGSVVYEYFVEKQNKLMIEQYDSYKAGLFDLLAGRIDAFSCPQPTLLALAQEAGIEYKIRITGAPVTEIKRGIAVAKNNTLLHERLNKAVVRFVRSREYQEIYVKWYGKPSSYWTVRKVVIVMSSAIILAIVLMAAWWYISIVKLNRELLKSVAELKKAEQNRVRLETAIIWAADAIVLTDAKGVIQYVNPAFERLTGFTRDEAAGRDLHMLDSGKHDDSYYREMREVLQRDGVWTGRLVNKKKDNSLYEEECTFSQVKEPGGAVINYVAIKRDVTERLRLESIAATMECMNNLGYIFSGVRHEIANPVSSLRLLLSLMKKELPNLDKPAMESYLDRSLSKITKLDYLLDTLRNFNMYEKLEIRDINVEDFLENFHSLVREDFANKRIGISIRIEPGVNVISADPRALQQVLVNLFANASDALQARKDPKISVSVFRAEHGAGLRIEDNGQGMSEDEQRHIFKPFYTTKIHGTGLGMVIVKKMLTGMNSTIKITSRKDSGTIVEILLPVPGLTSKAAVHSQPSGVSLR